MDIVKSLQNIGLTEKESKIYTALLQLGRTTAYSVSVKAELKRPTTYLLLDSLVEKGFALKVPRSKRKMYVANPPEEVFALARERVESAEKSLAELKSITKKTKGKTQTLYFEGHTGLKQALNYRMKDQVGNELVGFYATGKGVSENALKVAEEWVEDLKKNRITIRGFAPKDKWLSEYRGKDEKYGREIRTLPISVYSSTVSIDTVKDFVRIVDLLGDGSPQVTIIENPEVAKTLREIFEVMWQKLPEDN